MKHLLNKTLTVKQVSAVAVLLIAILAVTFVFMTGGEDVPLKDKVTQENDSTPEELIVEKDTSALGRLLAFIEDSINAASQLRGGSWSYYLGPVDADTAIYEHNSTTGMVPASVMKVVTTGTALSILGPGYRFTTLLQHDGVKEGNTLLGNIYIRGNGDPTLGSETYGSSVEKVVNNWATAIQGMGIDSVSGCIIGDAEAFERDMTPGGWCWEDVQSDYGAGPCGLSIHENQFSISLNASGGHVSMSYTPKIPGMKLYNQCINNASIGKSYAYVTGGPYQFDRVVQGEVNGHLDARGSIPDPALLCAQLLKTELEERGIKVGDSATTIRLIRLNGLKLEAEGGRKVITSTSSATLRDLVYHTNQISQNFYAETILRAISHKQKGYGSTFGGAGCVYEFWKKHNVDIQGLYMVDGSGLSRNNSITTKQLVSMLRVFAKDSVMFESFYRSLPVAGESGTIRKLADSTAAEGNLRAKSGTMSRVRAYAGYVDTRSGKRMAFAMIGNNTQWELSEIRDKFEKLFVLMAELP